MKRYYYVVLIFLFSIIQVFLLSQIIGSIYFIPIDLVEGERFRAQDISPKAIKEAKEISIKNDYDFSGVLAVNYLLNRYNVKRIHTSNKEFKKSKRAYTKLYPKEFSHVLKAMSAIYDDLEYFPVAKSKTSDYWVGFDDSFGAGRNYNGSYKHEGCDIMAENNISGYYPVVSATDGVVENIGWLEKGGYRIGIRSNSGGYFYYAHLSSYADVKKGDKIKAGELLGYMGDTGYGKLEGTSGKFDVHLHFGVYIKTDNYEEISMNPYNILKYLEKHLYYAEY